MKKALTPENEAIIKKVRQALQAKPNDEISMTDLLGLKGLSNDRLVAEISCLFETERVATVKPPHGAFLVSQVRGDVTSFRIGAGSPDSLFTSVH
jgi:hypothetical protein